MKAILKICILLTTLQFVNLDAISQAKQLNFHNEYEKQITVVTNNELDFFKERNSIPQSSLAALTDRNTGKLEVISIGGSFASGYKNWGYRNRDQETSRSEEINLKIENLGKEYSIDLLAETGELIDSYTEKDNKESEIVLKLSTAVFPKAGLYYYRITTNGTVITKRILIRK